MSEFQHLFQPLAVGSRTVKNRIASTAHVPRYGEGGLLTEHHVRYLERKAAGGAGLVVAFGSAGVHEGAAGAFETVDLWNGANEEPLRDLAERVHAHGCLLLSQATHMGRRATSLRGGVVKAPSAVPELVHAEIPQALGTSEIRSIVASFAAAARTLEACGWDGIEITSFGGHLIEQFWSPAINRRADEYGGDLAGRMRFSIEVVAAVAEAVSDDFVVALRMTGDPACEAVGLDAGDMLEIAARLDALGRIDLFDISGGTGATREAQVGTVPPDSFPPGCYNHLARAMKARLSVPVLVAGRILDPVQAERALAAGDCDLVGMTRALIADPDLPRRVEAGESERVRPCIAISDECIGRGSLGLPMRCAVNPETGLELEPDAFSRRPARARTVVVVGGGAAGIEAARVAGERGHEVVLIERLDVLGGQIVAAARAPDRPHIGLYAPWLARELERLRVDVRLGVDGAAAAVLDARPDAVIVATGAETVVPEEAAAARTRCATDVDLLEGRVALADGARVLVYDREANVRGASAALLTAAAGPASVELAAPLLDACEKVDPWQRPDVLRRLFAAGVACTTNEILAPGRDGRPFLRHAWSGRERSLDDFDLVVFAGYREPRAAVGAELASAAPGLEIRLVGDCVAPRRLYDAVVEGARAGAAV